MVNDYNFNNVFIQQLKVKLLGAISNYPETNH